MLGVLTAGAANVLASREVEPELGYEVWVILVRLPDGSGGWQPAVVLKGILVYDEEETEEERAISQNQKTKTKPSEPQQQTPMLRSLMWSS